MFQMKLSYFTLDETFPFFIQYGMHKENLFLHSHEDFSELVIVLSGTATHLVNDEEFYITKGDVFIIGADTVHGYQDTHDFHICNIMFQNDFFFENEYDIKKTPGFQGLFIIEPILSQKRHFHNMLKLDLYDFETVKKMIDRMIEEYYVKQAGYKTLLTGCFYELSVMLSRLYTKSGEHSENDVIGMAKSIAYLESHYMEELTLKEIAKIAGFSPRHFSRRFYEIKQTTPVHYIQLMRTQQAAFYLKSTDLPVSIIAAKCGFSDSNYFSRLFKKHYKVSPSEFRKKNSQHIILT